MSPPGALKTGRLRLRGLHPRNLFKDMEYLSGMARNYRDSTAVGAPVRRFNESRHRWFIIARFE